MKVTIEKRVTKELKKLPQPIQKKYKNFLNDLMLSHSLHNFNPKWSIGKLHNDNSMYRAKLDLWYRVGFVKNEDTQSIQIIKVSSREDFQYVGTK